VVAWCKAGSIATELCTTDPLRHLLLLVLLLAPAAQLEAFSKGFRAAFQVPDAVPSLAGLITTSRHQRWIEGFLAQSATA